MRIPSVLFSMLAALVLAGMAAHGEPRNELQSALKLKPSETRGRVLYETCAACHQADGRGDADNAVPAIAGQRYGVILKQLADFRDNERWDERMNAFTDKHHLANAQALADVAHYISRLPPVATTDLGPGDAIDTGKLFYTNACAQCHGAGGEGNAKLRYPRLAGQHYRYLNRQMIMMARGGRTNVSWDHGEVLGTLTERQRNGIADYLSRMKETQ